MGFDVAERSDRRRDNRSQSAPHRGRSSDSSHSGNRRSNSNYGRPSSSGPAARRDSGPRLPEGIDPATLDPAIRAQLRQLPKEIADLVASHLVAAGQLIDTDPKAALAHAQAARVKAPRFSLIREAVAECAYQAEDWHLALVEFRTARRVSGNNDFLPLIIDCERALGRREKAWTMLEEAGKQKLSLDVRMELVILGAGMHREDGANDRALKLLEIPELHHKTPTPWLARLRYSYAELLQEAGQVDKAREWFTLAGEVDLAGVTPAGETLLELDGISWEEHEELADGEDPTGESPEPNTAATNGS